MSRRKCYRGEINIFYFFIVALLIHLSMFLFREFSTKGDSNLALKTNGAPISVQFRSETLKKPRPQSPSKEQEAASTPKVEEQPKVVQEDFLSKIKDNKKKEKKVEKKNEIVPKKEDKKIDKKATENSEASKASPALPPNTPTDVNSDQDFLSGNFSIGEDGNIVAASSEGIEYHILKQIDPEYPAQAKKINYSQKVVVQVKFLVGLNGEIEDIKIIKSHSKLGFDNAVLEALKGWKFKPIYYKNKNIKVYFTKSFVFEKLDE